MENAPSSGIEEGCAGWQDFGYNRKRQARQCVMILIGSAVTAWVFTRAKSRESNTEMQSKTPKMLLADFGNTLWDWIKECGQ